MGGLFAGGRRCTSDQFEAPKSPAPSKISQRFNASELVRNAVCIKRNTARVEAKQNHPGFKCTANGSHPRCVVLQTEVTQHGGPAMPILFHARLAGRYARSLRQENLCVPAAGIV